ncbi:hypothetical protein BKA70DRAFT_1325160 [Coprinopsis sp. MPI-PUGE-AT-0042]|nr:hypothetical protein BKA70DRAFT_1325160 [Coprinopsis sp. MPI-PUGE-AT-0042]
MEASTSHSLGNTSSHSVQHLEPAETRSSTNDNFRLSLDTRFTSSSPPFSQHLAKSPPVRIGDLEMNMNPSTRLPFDPGLEQTWRLESARRRRQVSSPSHCIHGIRRICKQPAGAQTHRTRNKRQRTELKVTHSAHRPYPTAEQGSQSSSSALHVRPIIPTHLPSKHQLRQSWRVSMTRPCCWCRAL